MNSQALVQRCSLIENSDGTGRWDAKNRSIESNLSHFKFIYFVCYLKTKNVYLLKFMLLCARFFQIWLDSFKVYLVMSLAVFNIILCRWIPKIVSYQSKFYHLLQPLCVNCFGKHLRKKCLFNHYVTHKSTHLKCKVL